MPLDPILIALALLLGVLMSRTTLCTVACVQQWVVARRVEGLLRIVAVVGAAMIALLASALLRPDAVALPMAQPIGLALCAGAVLLGAGSVVNGGCYLGSVLYLSRGNLNFLGTIAGLALGLALAPHSLAMQMATGHRMAMTSFVTAALLIAAIALLAAAVAHARSTRRVAAAERAPPLALAAGAGLVAGLIYAGHPDWNYSSVLTALVRAGSEPIAWAGQYAALALFAGATAGALAAHRFRFEAPTPRRLARCLAGGALMGVGASLIPGGHDLLLLWTIPGLALHGVIAYGIVVATIALLLAVGARRARLAAAR